MKNAIEVEKLTKIYGSGNTEVVAMNNVSMSVKHGEITALLGPSGSGKSTFLTSVGLINSLTSGRITIADTLICDGERHFLNLRKFRQKHIGFIFQKSNLIPFLTAKENVEIAMEMAGLPKKESAKRAMNLLTELDLAARANNYPSMLSGGQQQRVAICRALANKPNVILADEPTAALDSKLGRHVMELLKNVSHEYGTAVIVVTHDHRALDVFDSIYEMEDGQIKASTPP